MPQTTDITPAQVVATAGRLWVGAMAVGHAPLSMAARTASRPAALAPPVSCDAYLLQAAPTAQGKSSRLALDPSAVVARGIDPERLHPRATWLEEVCRTWRRVVAAGRGIEIWARELERGATTTDHHAIEELLAQVARAKAGADRTLAALAQIRDGGDRQRRGRPLEARLHRAQTEAVLAGRRAQSAMATAVARPAASPTEERMRERLREVVADWLAALADTDSEETATVG